MLARFTGPEGAARLDALLEGMIMHALLSTDREPHEETRAAIVQVLGPAAGSDTCLANTVRTTPQATREEAADAAPATPAP